MNRCKKEVDMFSEKKHYLLGITTGGSKVWLAEALRYHESYWGFGYIITFISNIPSKSRYRSERTYWDYSIVREYENNLCLHINDNEDFEFTVVDNNESWLLSELMKTFYSLSSISELYKHGDSRVTKNPMKEKLKNEKQFDEINKILLPELFQEVYKLLTP